MSRFATAQILRGFLGAMIGGVMTSRFSPGDHVQTPLGKGVVREVRGQGRLAVDVGGRTVVVEARAVTPIALRSKTARGRPPGEAMTYAAPLDAGAVLSEVDLHGLSVDEALVRVERAINDALLADLPALRLIHGRSGGRIRSTAHRWLRQMPSVRAFRLDPRNEGVTVVTF